MPKNRRLFKKSVTKSIPFKANKILNFILLAFVLLALRCWHLSVIQYDQKLEEAKRPQQRMVIERAERGTIRDRFNQPLAVNKVQYNAAVFYAHIRSLPTIRWEKNREGVRIKRYKRREHITELSKMLADELRMDPERIEDLIHSKAALFPNTPFVIKEDISEEEFFRLKAKEKDWVGLYAERQPKRFYPRGKTANSIIGYMGAISREEYLSVASEKRELENYLKAWEEGASPDLPQGMHSVEEVVERHKILKQRAYSINDFVGKTGIESVSEEGLRGYYGKKNYYSDARGNFLRELPGSREPLSGQRYVLSISAELQEYAEKLLMQSEELREGRSTSYDWNTHTITSLKQPWIKGGAIVAMDPNNGEVLALASYPRFDPNDFIPSGNPAISKKKNSNINKWFENESYIAKVWEGRLPLEREQYSAYHDLVYEEQKRMTWENYLDRILPKENGARQVLKRVGNIRNAVAFQKSVREVFEKSGQKTLYKLFRKLFEEEDNTPYGRTLTQEEREDLRVFLQENESYLSSAKEEWNKFFYRINLDYDKVLAIDLCRLIVAEEKISKELLEAIGEQTLSEYHQATSAMQNIESVIKEMVRELFRARNFKVWRNEKGKSYLRQKRDEEVQAGRYSKPYLDYFDQKERSLFSHFWEENRYSLLAAFLKGVKPLSLAGETEQIYRYLLAWERELSQGAHALMPWYQHYRNLHAILSSIPQEQVIPFLQSMRSYKELTSSLYGRYRGVRRYDGRYLEKSLASAFYPLYGYGYARSFAYRQATPQGSLFKLVVAYETLLQRYLELEERGERFKDLNPLDMIDNVRKVRGGKRSRWIVGYKVNGEVLTQHYKGGRLPRSAHKDIGKIDLEGAIESSSNPYFSLLASEVIRDPLDLNEAARVFSLGEKTGINLTGEYRGNLPNDITRNKTGLYSYAIGQHTLTATPLQTAVMLSALANGGKVFVPKIINISAGSALEGRDQFSISSPIVKREIHLPDEVRRMIFRGMRKTVRGDKGSARPSNIHSYYEYPYMLQNYRSLTDQMIGKTSTAEILQTIDLDLETGTQKYKHIGFGAISFNSKDPEKEDFQDPELVVVVYLQYGHYGKEAVPLASEMIKKWREIKERRS